MTQKDLDTILENDQYHIPRNKTEEHEIRLFLREEGYHCPLCGKELQSRKQLKPKQKKFEIAHIYPNRPTIKQYNVLHNLERLGMNSEDFENKIALCLDCHNQQDYHTTKEEYQKLLNIKKSCLERNAVHDAVNDLHLESELVYIVDRICKITSSNLAELNLNPVPIANKFKNDEILLKTKITGYVASYYLYIRDLFREHNGKNGFVFDALCCEVKAAYLKMKSVTKNKEDIFAQLSDLIKRNTASSNRMACEAIAAFFVQNCEVFDEIPR